MAQTYGMADIWIGGIIALCTLGMGYLGVHMSLYPPETDKIKSRYRAAFLAATTIVLCLTIWQSIRSQSTQSITEELLSTIGTQTRQIIGRLGTSPLRVEVVNSIRDQKQEAHWIEDLRVEIFSATMAGGLENSVGYPVEAHFRVTTPVSVHPARIKIEFENQPNPDIKISPFLGQGTKLVDLKQHLAGKVLELSFDDPSFIPGSALTLEVKSDVGKSIQPIGAWRWGTE